MSVGELAGLVVAVFWAVLVTFLATVLVRLAQALRETTRLVAEVSERAVPLLGDAADAVRGANEQLARVDEITADVRDAAANASALSSTVAATLGGPLVKVAAFSHGVRRAAARRQGGDLRHHLPHQADREAFARLVRAEVRAATAPRRSLAGRLWRAMKG